MAKFEFWKTEEGLILLQQYTRNGLTYEEIAKTIGINIGTLYDWQKRFPEISEALKKGKDVVNAIVESALLKNCVSGDTTAQIFWLSNRVSDRWKRNPENSNNNKDKGTIKELIEALRNTDV